MCNFLIAPRVIFLLALIIARARADLKTLPREGVTTLVGWEDLSYQAVQWEPLCGNLGGHTRYSISTDVTNTCKIAVDSFKNTPDSFALYDNEGTRLEGARVGGGTDVCMCFALTRSGSNPLTGALCLSLTGAGVISEESIQDVTQSGYRVISIASSNYRPNVADSKALPLCGGRFNITSAKVQWSSTAALETELTAVETISTVGDATKPPVVPYTTLSTYTTTNPDGSTETLTDVRTMEAPVVTVVAGVGASGLSQGDKVGLGVGLGIGLPLLVGLVVWAAIACLLPRLMSGRKESQQVGYGGIASANRGAQ